DLLIKILRVPGGLFLGTGNSHHHRKQVVRSESWVHVLQSEKAAEHEAGAGQQHHRQSKFGSDQKSAEPIVSQSITGATLALFQCVTEIRRSASPRRSQTENHSGQL